MREAGREPGPSDVPSAAPPAPERKRGQTCPTRERSLPERERGRLTRWLCKCLIEAARYPHAPCVVVRVLLIDIMIRRCFFIARERCSDAPQHPCQPCGWYSRPLSIFLSLSLSRARERSTSLLARCLGVAKSLSFEQGRPTRWLWRCDSVPRPFS